RMLSDFDRAILHELRREVDAEAGRFQYGPLGQILLPPSRENVAVIFGLLVAFLHDEEVRTGRGDVHAGGRTDGAVGIVRGEGDIVRVRHGDDLFHGGDAAGAGHVGLD